MEKFFLSTYRLRIRNKRSEKYAIMGKFNDTNDIYPLIIKFLNELFETPLQIANDEDQNTFLNLTLVAPPNILEEKRVIYGHFDAGVSGQEILVKNRHDKSLLFRGDRDNHSLNRDLFFYFQIPYNSDSGYLIFQKKSRFGIKSGFNTLFKKWIRQNGYENTIIFINPTINSKVFERMLELGSLKKVNFIESYIPNDIRDFYQNNENPFLKEGHTVVTIQSKRGLSENWIRFAKQQFSKNERRTLIEYEDGTEGREYEEIQFELEYNGRTKTFYANKSDKIVPDIDVTLDVEYDEKTGQPILSSLMEVCEQVIQDTFILTPNV